MSKASPTTYRIGSIGEFAAWTRDVVRHEPPGSDAPREWFDNDAAARQRTQRWEAELQERIDAATKMLPLLPVAEQQKQKHQIAGLKAALKKGLAGNQAAGAAAAKTRRRKQVAAT